MLNLAYPNCKTFINNAWTPIAIPTATTAFLACTNFYLTNGSQMDYIMRNGSLYRAQFNGTDVTYTKVW